MSAHERPIIGGQAILVANGDRCRTEEILKIGGDTYGDQALRWHQKPLQNAKNTRYDDQRKYQSHRTFVLSNLGSRAANEVDEHEIDGLSESEQLRVERQIGAEPEIGADEVNQSRRDQTSDPQIRPGNGNPRSMTGERAKDDDQEQ